MARRKRLEESRAQTSGLRLERAQLTESTVLELQDDMDEIHEILKEKDKAADAEDEKMHQMLVTNRFAPPPLYEVDAPHSIFRRGTYPHLRCTVSLAKTSCTSAQRQNVDENAKDTRRRYSARHSLAIE